MPILNYTTKIDSVKTIGQITQLLVEKMANKISVDYENGLPVNLTFQIIHENKPVLFSLPANWEGVLHVLENQKGVPKNSKNKEQAVRVAWRILKDWVEAQMAVIEAEMVTLVQVFLPYAVMSSGKTLYEELDSVKFLKP